MKLRIILHSMDKKTIPIDYTHQLQGAVLNLLPKELNKKVHNEGIRSKLSPEKVFRPLNVSRLQFEKFKAEEGIIYFEDPVALFVSSYDEKLLNKIANNLFQRDKLIVSGTPFSVGEISFMAFAPKEDREEFIVKTLSPVIVMDTKDNQTFFYNPCSPQFADKIVQNLKEKYSAITGETKVDDMCLSISLLWAKKELVKYKNLVLNGFSGEFILKGDIRLIKTAFDLGLGNRTFYCGCVMI